MSLQPLANLRRADLSDAIDFRSWHVVSRDGTPLGAVAEVIVDVDDDAPVYLNVLPAGHPDGAGSECWVRIPFRHVRVDEDARRVVLGDLAMLGLGTATIDPAGGAERAG